MISCSTIVARITYEGDTCAARRGTTGDAWQKVAEFPAEPAIFASALAYLAANQVCGARDG